MIIRNKLWEELKQAHMNILTIEWYTDKQRLYNRIYGFILAIIAGVGAFGEVLEEYLNFNVSFWSCLIIGIMSITKALLAHFLQSEEDLLELDILMNYYAAYMNELERLFYLFDNSDKYSEEEIMEKFYTIKKKECDKRSKMNRMIRFISNKRETGLRKKSDDYLQRVYYNIYEKLQENE